jgi:hypothetical protein
MSRINFPIEAKQFLIVYKHREFLHFCRSNIIERIINTILIMSGFQVQDLGIASSIFIGLYVIFMGVNFLNGGFVFTRLMMFTQIHSALKIIGQIFGVVIAKNGFKPSIVACYTVFNSLAIIPLIMAGYCFLFKSNGQIGPAEKINKIKNPRKYTLFLLLKIMVCVTTGAAVVCTVVGVAIIAKDNVLELDLNSSSYKSSKILRAIGQCFFLLQLLTTFIMTTYTISTNKNMDLTFSIITTFLISLVLVVRGIYGVMGCFIDKMSIYTSTTSFVVYEYPMGVAMEYLAVFLSMWSYCCLLEGINLGHEEPFLTEEEVQRDDSHSSIYSQKYPPQQTKDSF